MTQEDKELGELIQLNALLKADQVAGILQISKSFAFRLMQRGVIPTIRIGRCVRVREQDLREYIDINRR